MSYRLEVGLCGVLAIATYAFAVVPHVLDYGWAWGRPGAGLGGLLFLLGTCVWIVVAGIVLGLLIARPKRPRAVILLRITAVVLIVVGPAVVFGSYGGLAKSQGRGLVDRVRQETPLDALQSWAIRVIASGRDATPEPMPAEVRRTLLPNPRVSLATDHVMIVWYDVGIFAGDSSFEVPRADSYFFLERVRPGIYVFVEEH